jgi:transketolase
MRRTCLSMIEEMAAHDDRVVFIGSDITKRELVTFQTNHPDRFFMEGVQEQHIIGMAAGLAMSGKIPFINTIASFLTRRCYEQLLVDLGVHNQPVRLIGSGGGTVYAPLGVTHIANEDIAILSAIPNMTIIAVCDAQEMKQLMPLTLDWPHPIYIRLAKGGDKVVSNPDNPFEIGKATSMREGKDVLFISTGITTALAIDASETLSKQGYEVSVLHIHTIKPLDIEQITRFANNSSIIVTIEEHRKSGGLGSSVAETLLEKSIFKPFKRIGFPDVFTEEHGSQTEIMNKYGITAQNAVSVALELLSKI